MAAVWKAAIDFKSIIENKSSVAENLKNRSSNANLELVIQLYHNLLALQKVRIISFYDYSFLTVCVEGLIVDRPRGYQEVEDLRYARNVVANKMKGKVEPLERQTLIEEGMLYVGDVDSYVML